jgi:hypothetical protein
MPIIKIEIKRNNLSPTPPSILIENTASINKTTHD